MSGKLLSVAVLVLSASVALAQTSSTGDASSKESRGNRTDPATRFKELDKNADGKLSLDELSSAQFGRPAANSGSSSSSGAPAVSIADHFKTADTNADGSLSVDEFTAMMQSMRSGGGGKSGGGKSGGGKSGGGGMGGG